mgnify:CR=1 FL=1
MVKSMRAVLLLLTGILLTTPAVGKPTQIIIAGDNWCPINCSASAADKGYMIDVASQAFAKWQYSDLASLRDVRLGTINGYDYGDELNNYLAVVTPPLMPEVKQLSGDDAVKRNIAFLLKRRTDVLVESAPVLWYHANQLGVADQLQEAGVISAPEPCFIAFSPNRPESAQLIHALDAGITSMKQQNALLPIAKRYGLSSVLAPVVSLPE